jgi:hypothetical protein
LDKSSSSSSFLDEEGVVPFTVFVFKVVFFFAAAIILSRCFMAISHREKAREKKRSFFTYVS